MEEEEEKVNVRILQIILWNYLPLPLSKFTMKLSRFPKYTKVYLFDVPHFGCSFEKVIITKCKIPWTR